jgi:hypothetical protein
MLLPWDDENADVHGLWDWIGRNKRMPTWIDTIEDDKLLFKSKYLCVEKSTKKVYYYNGAHVGEVGHLEDGYYYFWVATAGGAWGPGELRIIADMLDELNKDWNKTVEEGLKND